MQFHSKKEEVTFILTLRTYLLIYSGTETGKAIHFMSDQLSNSTINNFGARSNSKIVAVVITDGRSNDFPLVGTGQEELKKIVDVVIAVGVNMKKEA